MHAIGEKELVHHPANRFSILFVPIAIFFGILTDGSIAGAFDHTCAAISESSTAEGGIKEASPAFGEHRVLVILARFADDPEGVDPNPPDDFVHGRQLGCKKFDIHQPADGERVMFDDRYPQPWGIRTVNDYYREVSYDLARITGDVVGYYTLDIDVYPRFASASALRSVIRATAIAAAAADGVDVGLDGLFLLGAYDMVVIVVPPVEPMVAGFASGPIAIQTSLEAGLTIHEMGHLFGLSHGFAWDCHDAVWSSEESCIHIEYGHVFDPMGASELPGHLNPGHKKRLGWISDEQSPLVTEDGVFELTPLETESGLKAIRVPLEENADYWFSFRRPIGFDGILMERRMANGEFDERGFDGAELDLIWYDGDGGAWLLDATPRSDGLNSLIDRLDGILKVGKRFEDARAGARVEVLGINGSGANAVLRVGVSFSPVAIALPESVLIDAGASVVLEPQFSGGVSPYECSWTPTDGLDDPNSCTVTATPDERTTYQLTVRDAAEDPIARSRSITVNRRSILRVPSQYAKIRFAIEAAQDGDTVLIADGTYIGSDNRNLDFAGKAITVRSENGPADCTIDCQGQGRAFLFHNGETSQSRVEGFTIINGSSTFGGAIRCTDSDPVISDCVIRNCEAAWGGGILLDGGSRARIENCVVTNNEAFTSHGGGIYTGGGQALIIDSVIADNVADGRGGGVLAAGSGVIIRRCTIAGNVSGGEGGGLSAESSSTPLLRHCILWDNDGSIGDSIFVSPSSTLSAEYSNVQSWAVGNPGPGVVNWGPGMMDAEPLFASAPGIAHDYHITPNSPCRNAGSESAEPSTSDRDVDGEARLADGRIDIGADEYHDCDKSGLADYRQIDIGLSDDCNANGRLDVCDLDEGISLDCNANGIPDECEFGGDADCDGNGESDLCDLFSGASVDCDGGGIPDECEPDCNGTGVADACDIFMGTSEDCTGNGIPDECEEDCNHNRSADVCELASGLTADCNNNSRPDVCDVADGTSEDCTGNGIPDECEADCNLNGVSDLCEIAGGVLEDCDGNDVPDLCQLPPFDGTTDCNGNMLLDFCESADCNGNVIPDVYEVCFGLVADCNLNDIPDSCDVATGGSHDVDADGVPDECDRVGFGDSDCDGDIDLLDFGMLQLCFTESDCGQLDGPCRSVDFDEDGDVDLIDFSNFSICYTGQCVSGPCHPALYEMSENCGCRLGD